MNYVFVCDSGIVRSKIAAQECRKILKDKHLEAKISTTHLRNKKVGFLKFILKFFPYMFTKPLTEKIVDESDLAFVMEPWMEIKILGMYKQYKKKQGTSNKLVCLNIEDSYWQRPKVRKEIRMKLRSYFNDPASCQSFQ